MPLGIADTALRTDDYAAFILGPLLQRSVVLRNIQTIQTTASRLHIPKGKAATVSWVPEHQPIPESADLVDEIVAVPQKAAALATLSNELVNDSSPGAAQVVQDILVRSVAAEVDSSFFTGSGLDGQPEGVADLVGTGTGALSLDGIADAAATIEANGGSASVVWLNPADYSTIVKGLTTHPSVSPTGQVQRSLLGIPVETTAALAAGTGYVADGQQVIAVVRTDGEIAASGEARFANYQTQVRVVTRVAYAYPFPELVVELSAA
jgi:HK97 family phage major capsid protein